MIESKQVITINSVESYRLNYKDDLEATTPDGDIITLALSTEHLQLLAKELQETIERLDSHLAATDES
jgi:hypothetical protein